MTNSFDMSSNLHYNILNTKTVLRKDTIMKIITSTLLIATLFTSNIIASQGCANGTCMASFGKRADDKVVATNTSFKTDVLKNNILAISQPLETQDSIEIETVQERPYVAVNEYKNITPFIVQSENNSEENIDTIENFENNLEENIDTIENFENNLEENIDTIENFENNLEENIDTIENFENIVDTDTQIATNTKQPYCEEYQGVLTCDITTVDDCTCA